MADINELRDRFMAEQQRIRGVNDDQRRRVLESGEQQFKGNPLSLVPLPIQQLEANIAVAVPRAVTDTVTMAGMVPPMVRAGLSSDVDLSEAMMGKEGEDELTNYIATTAQKEFDELPETVKNDTTLKNLQQTIANSAEAEDIRLKHSNPVVNYGTKASNAINKSVGLGRVSQETNTDDLEQLAAGVLIPAGGVSRAVGGTVRRFIGDSIAGKVAGKAAELAADLTVPGTTNYTGKGIATNAGVQIGVNEGIRRAYDLPAITTGDAFLTTADVTTGQPDGAISAQVDPDSDPEGGMGGFQRARDYAVEGSMVLGAVFAAGRANKVASKVAMETVDEINTNHIAPPKAPPMDPQLKPHQRLASEVVDEAAPLGDSLWNADPDTFVKEKANIDRVVSDANSINIHGTYDNFLNTGNLDNLTRKTIPIAQMEHTLTRMSPPDQDVFNNGMLAKRLLDNFAVRTKSIDEQLYIAQIRGDQTLLHALLKEKSELGTDADAFGGKMTHADATAAAQALDNHPQAGVIEAMYQQIQNDGLEADLNGGYQTIKSIDKMKKAYPNYMTLQEDNDAGVSYMGKLFKNEFMGKGKWDRPPMFNAVRPGTRATKETGTVKNPISPMEAIKDQFYRRIADFKRNDAIKTYVETMKMALDHEKSIRHIESVSLDDFNRSDFDKMTQKANYIAYRENGMIHYYETADPEVARALEFNAGGTLTGFNMSRKVKQSWTTGIYRPIFATTAMKMENSIIKATRPAGRSAGMLDAGLRRAFPDSKALSFWLDKFGTNPVLDTFALQQLHAIFMQNSMTALKAVGTGIGDALAENTAFGRAIKAMPGGEQVLSRTGEIMVRTANESRYNAALHANALNGSLLTSPLDGAKQGFDAVDYAMKKSGLRSTYKGYKAFIDSIHNSGKYAFFAQNFAALERKHGGRANIPAAELKKLSHETRVASGDMSKIVGNKTLQKLQSATPYSSIAVNATRHLASAIINDPNTRWRIVSGSIAPKVAMVGLITAASPEMREWYWDHLPSWQRSQNIPIIGPDWWMDAASGNMRALTPNDMYLVREDPGIAAISSSVVAALRSLGAFGDEQQSHANFAREFKAAVGGSMSVPLPPFLDLMLAGGDFDPTAFLLGDPTISTPYEDRVQGINTDQINADSDFSKGWMTTIESLAGVGAANLVGSIDVGVQAYDNTNDFTDALKQTFQYMVYTGERAAAETPGVREAGASLFSGGQRRIYAGTEQRGRVTENFAKVEGIRKQLSMEKDTKNVDTEMTDAGFQGMQRIQDPQVRSMAQEISKAFYSGKLKSLSSERASRTKKLAMLEAQKDSVSPTVFDMEHRKTVGEMHALDAQQEAYIDMFEERLRQQYGVDIDGAIDVIHQSLGRGQE